MSQQLSLLDLIGDDNQAPTTAVAAASSGDPRVAAARASLAQATTRRDRPEPPAQWVAVRLDPGTCELGRRRVANAREVIAAARERALEAAQTEASARQRAALVGVISTGRPSTTEDALQLPARRTRRARPAA